MTFRQAILMISEFKAVKEEQRDIVSSILRRSKDVMPVFDVTRGIYE